MGWDRAVVSHPSGKDKNAARVHPTNKDLFVGTPGWGTRPAAMTMHRGGFEVSHPSGKDKNAASVHPTNKDLFVGTPGVGHPAAG